MIFLNSKVKRSWTSAILNATHLNILQAFGICEKKYQNEFGLRWWFCKLHCSRHIYAGIHYIWELKIYLQNFKLFWPKRFTKIIIINVKFHFMWEIVIYLRNCYLSQRFWKLSMLHATYFPRLQRFVTCENRYQNECGIKMMILWIFLLCDKYAKIHFIFKEYKFICIILFNRKYF